MSEIELFDASGVLPVFPNAAGAIRSFSNLISGQYLYEWTLFDDWSYPDEEPKLLCSQKIMDERGPHFLSLYREETGAFPVLRIWFSEVKASIGGVEYSLDAIAELLVEP